jgi:hypothetical protein
MPVLLPFQKALQKQVRSAVSEVEAGANSKGILLIGGSGTGKTYAIDTVVSMYPPDFTHDQPISSVVRIATKADSDNISIAKSGLRQLGRTFRPNEKIKSSDIETLLHDALLARKTVIFILEEFHNALLKQTAQLRGKNEEFLKNLWNFFSQDSTSCWASSMPGAEHLKLVILVSGTESLLNVFPPHSELASRFGSVVMAKRLSMFPQSDFKYFREILLSFSERFDLVDIVNADDSDLAARLFLANQGHLRELESLFERVRTLRKKKSDDSTLALFGRAYQEVSTEQAKLVNPFLAPTDVITRMIVEERKRFGALPKAK